jgi:hypothetical protein
MDATFHAHVILLYLIILIIPDEEYNLWSSSFCSFLQPPVISCLFGPNILLSTLFSNTLSLCSLMQETKFHTRTEPFTSNQRIQFSCTELQRVRVNFHFVLGRHKRVSPHLVFVLLILGFAKFCFWKPKGLPSKKKTNEWHPYRQLCVPLLFSVLLKILSNDKVMVFIYVWGYVYLKRREP